MTELLVRADSAVGAPPRAPAHTLSTRQRVLLEIVIQYYRLTGEPCSASYLARRMHVHHSTVQEHLAVLHRKGWIVTASGPAVPRLDVL